MPIWPSRAAPTPTSGCTLATSRSPRGWTSSTRSSYSRSTRRSCGRPPSGRRWATTTGPPSTRRPRQGRTTRTSRFRKTGRREAYRREPKPTTPSTTPTCTSSCSIRSTWIGLPAARCSRGSKRTWRAPTRNGSWPTGTIRPTARAATTRTPRSSSSRCVRTRFRCSRITASISCCPVTATRTSARTSSMGTTISPPRLTRSTSSMAATVAKRGTARTSSRWSTVSRIKARSTASWGVRAPPAADLWTTQRCTCRSTCSRRWCWTSTEVVWMPRSWALPETCWISSPSSRTLPW